MKFDLRNGFLSYNILCFLVLPCIHVSHFVLLLFILGCSTYKLVEKKSEQLSARLFKTFICLNRFFLNTNKYKI